MYSSRCVASLLTVLPACSAAWTGPAGKGGGSGPSGIPISLQQGIDRGRPRQLTHARPAATTAVPVVVVAPMQVG